jgi:uncharacterized protein involved in exopolysaccharide biosynthesis
LRRYLETLFRHKSLFLIPVLAIPLVAMITFLYTGDSYRVASSVWVEPSPIDDPVTRGSIPPSEFESRALNEWLATEAFRKEVMDRVGLTAAIERREWPVATALQSQVRDIGLGNVPGLSMLLKAAGWVYPRDQEEALNAGLGMIEDTVRVGPEGTNLLRIEYVGAEPALGQRVIQETIALYNLRTLELRTSHANSSIDFYTRQVQVQEQRLRDAEARLNQFLELHPAPLPGQTRPPAEEAELENLRRAHTLEQTLYETALRRLEEFRISGEAAIADRGQTFRVIDQPIRFENVGYTARTLVMMIFLGVLLGLIFGLLPIMLLTWLDSTIRTREDIEKVVKAPLIVEVPLIPLRSGQPRDLARRALAYPSSPGSPETV